MTSKDHWKSLKITPFESLGMVSYSSSIASMVVYLEVYEIFSVKEWHDLQNWVRDCSRLLKMALFDRPYTTFCWSALLTFNCAITFSLSNATWKPICSNSVLLCCIRTSVSLDLKVLYKSVLNNNNIIIISIAPSCTVWSYFALNNVVTLKSRLGVSKSHLKWHHSKAWVRFPIRLA